MLGRRFQTPPPETRTNAKTNQSRRHGTDGLTLGECSSCARLMTLLRNKSMGSGPRRNATAAISLTNTVRRLSHFYDSDCSFRCLIPNARPGLSTESQFPAIQHISTADIWPLPEQRSNQRPTERLAGELPGRGPAKAEHWFHPRDHVLSRKQSTWRLWIRHDKRILPATPAEERLLIYFCFEAR